MKFINVFNQGMKKDLAKNIFKPDTYYHAENFSLITEKGLSTGNLRTTKGNTEFFELPDSSNVVSITKNNNGSSQITIQGQTFTVDFTSNNWRSNLSSLINSDSVLISLGITSTYSNTQVVVYSLLDNIFNLITANITASINNSNGIINTSYLNAVVNPKILGWGIIRDEIYIFSTTETSPSSTSSQGQVWKVTYDKFINTSSISLIYHGALNFSLAHPIANPGMIVGNYENDLVKNLYFTDNYNTPKKINVGDPNLMGLTNSDLNLTPDIITGVSTIQEILGSGSLKLGNYAVSYKLSTTSGSTTSYFPQSNYIPILLASDTSGVLTYQTSSDLTVTANKSLSCKIFNIDTSFDRVIPVIIYKSSPGALPIITELTSQPIPGNGEFSFTYSGTEVGVDVTIQDYFENNLNFETVKTIQAKNNILFFGNVKYSDFDVSPSFDTRAYRFSGNNSATPRKAELTNSQGILEYTIDGTAPNYLQVLETADVIQDPEIKQAPYSFNNFLYQADGVTFGGSGPNISYRFETYSNDASIKDNPYKISLDTNVFGGSNQAKKVPYAVPANSTLAIDLDQDPLTQYDSVDNNGAFDSAVSPYHQYQLKGYQRDEIYRFGIVFFSKKGETSYAHWIADIRMPNIWMPSQDPGKPADNRDEFSFPSSSFLGNNWYGNNLQIIFDIDVTSIKDQISGYKIVRLPRKDSDKTILAQGVLMPVIQDGSNNYTIEDDQYYYDVAAGIPGKTYSNSLCTFASPEFLFKPPISFADDDQIDIIGNLNIAAYGNVKDSSSVDVPLGFYFKSYGIENGGSAKNQPPIDLNGSSNLFTGIGGYQANLNGQIITNASNNIISAKSYGGKRIVVSANFLAHYGTPTGLTWQNILFDDGITEGTSGQFYLANYRRSNTNQYGGNSFSDRSQCEYISTGHYRKTDDFTTFYTETVFGGDIQISIFDYVNSFKNFTSIMLNSYNDTRLAGFLFPIECTFPVQLAVNDELTFNKGVPYGAYFSPTYDRIETQQRFSINFDFFVENDSQIYLPKPDPYIATNKYDVRVHRSQPKTNGELTDSWGIFKVPDFMDIDTIQGSLNQLIVHQDKLVAWQNQGICLLSVNERSVTQDNAGALQLAQGGVLARYDYISKVIGSQHQFGFTLSQDSVYFFDINTKNIYKLTQATPECITVSKSMSSYLNENLNGLLQVSDNPYLNKGVTATYDFHYNEAIMTFKDTTFSNTTKATISSIGPEDPSTHLSTVTFDFGRVPKPSCIVRDNTILVALTVNGVEILETGVVTAVSSGSIISAVFLNTQLSFADSIVNISCSQERSFTLAYNDYIDAFTTFYSFTPSVYINDQKNIISPDNTLNKFWLHDQGPYGSYYNTVYPSKLTLLLNESPTETKVFDNYQFLTEVVDETTNVNVIDKTFDTIRLYNDYQNSDFQTLPLDNTKVTARRVERNWNVSNIRNRVLYTTAYPDIFTDLSPTDILFAERFRDKYLFVDLEYSNLDNFRLVVNSFSTDIRKSAR